jgi:hypothetical protein
MRTIRRLYIYAVSFISLEVVLWGLIGLARSAFSGDQIGSDATRLASALALILVGVPVFLLHWWLAQRSIRNDDEERFSRLRAIFLYGALLATLIPIAQNTLALINNIWLHIFDLPSGLAILGGDQIWSDNLIAIVMNGLIAAYVYSVLRKDWGADPRGDDFPETRRLYRYIWLVYGLVMMVGGAIQVLSSLFQTAEVVGSGSQGLLPNGLSFLMTGIPIWILSWRITQLSLTEPAEQNSQIRLVLLYALSLIGVAGVLASVGQILNTLLQLIFGEPLSFSEFIFEIGDPLAIALTLGGLWGYYGRSLTATVGSLPDTPRRAGLRRLYYYILSAFGLAATFVGLEMLFSFLIDYLPGSSVVISGSLRSSISAALATLLVGLPLWLLAWRPIMREATKEGEDGDHARRSTVRKTYLYLALFAGVIGIMVSAGMLLFNLLSALLGDPPQDLVTESLNLGKSLLLFILLMLYHWQALRTDSRLANASLAVKHADFPVLVLTTEIGDFSESMVTAIQREAPALPVAVHLVENGAPDETLSGAKAVILPTQLIANPSEAIRLWLQGFPGERIVVPVQVEKWQWLFGSGQPLSNLARQASKAARHLAEGEEINTPRTASGWMIVLYVIGGIVIIPLVFSLISLFIELIR